MTARRRNRPLAIMTLMVTANAGAACPLIHRIPVAQNDAPARLPEVQAADSDWQIHSVDGKIV